MNVSKGLLERGYQGMLKGAKVCSDLRALLSYRNSEANRWEEWRQNKMSFEAFLAEDDGSFVNSQGVVEPAYIVETYTPLDMAIADRLVTLYGRVAFDESVEFVPRDTLNWELYDLLTEGKLVSTYPKMKRYT